MTTTPGYDGSINIDTRIDQKGFNAGLKNMTAKFGGLLRAVAGFGKVAGAILARAFSIVGVAAFIAAFQGAIASIRENIKTLFERMGKAKELEEIQSRFAELKMAVANAFLPLIVLALPYIKMVISWLTEMLNKVAMFVAAWTGAKQVLQVVAGSAENVADETKKAVGALAAFDQINVLDTQKGKPLSAAEVATELVPVESGIIEKIENIKAKFAEFKDWIIELWNTAKQKVEEVKKWFDEFGSKVFEGFALGGVIEFIKQKWEEFKPWFDENIWQPLKENASETWEKIKQWAAETWAKIQETWGNVKEWFSEIWLKVSQGASESWAKIQEILGNAKEWFKSHVTGPLAEFFSNLWENISTKASEVWTQITNVWNEVKSWFVENVWVPLQKGFDFVLNLISEKFHSVFDGILTFITDIVARIVETINNAFEGITGLNFGDTSIGGELNWGGGSKDNDTLATHTPRFATGSILPPSAEMAIRAPASGLGGGVDASAIESAVARAIGNQQITIKFAGDLAALVRELKPELDRENTRVGGRLAGFRL